MNGSVHPLAIVGAAMTLFLGFVSPVFAQENPFEGVLPSELGETVNKAKEALPDLINIIEIPQNSLGEGVSELSGETVVRDIESSLGGVWRSLGAWTEAKLGVNLTEAFTTVLNFVFFIIKLAVQLLRAVLNIIPF